MLKRILVALGLASATVAATAVQAQADTGWPL